MGFEFSSVIFGALAGGAVTLCFKLGEWYFNRRTLSKVLKKGLYFEIDNHKIIDLQKDEDGQPNFAIASFQDSFYTSNLSNITKILADKILQPLFFYYSHLKLAVDFQDELFMLNKEIDKIIVKTTGDGMRREKIETQRKHLKDSIRLILSTVQLIRNNLLANLTKVFKRDPTKLAFIDVLPKHKEWFTSLQKKEQAGNKEG
jgi:hypothetical protein